MGSYIRKIATLFKDAKLKVAFETTTTVGKLLSDTRKMNT
jgi:hypothetical protein